MSKKIINRLLLSLFMITFISATNICYGDDVSILVSNCSTCTFQDNNIINQENEVIRLVNIERSKNGLKPLAKNLQLSKTARLKSQDMINKNYFSHISPTYGSPFDMMKKFGIKYSSAGENIAYGQKTPAAVMKAWMNSPGHRKNILSPNFTQLGVGLAINKSGTPYWTQMFIKPLQ